MLKVTELFYTLQGEGHRTGTPTVFIRLQGCPVKHKCYASGVVCDTEFESGQVMGLEAILQWMEQHASTVKSITWTGGEPLAQLTQATVAFFKEKGYEQAVETSGFFPCPDGIDYISVSPKVAEHIVSKHFTHVNELRYVRHIGQSIPQPAIKADHYYLSPHFDGNQINQANLAHCIALCKQHPQWKLSVQTHKLINIL